MCRVMTGLCHKVFIVWLFFSRLAFPVPFVGGEPPEIKDVQAYRFIGYIWVEGYVVDPDSATTGYRVWFSGDVYGTATVDSTGRFAFVAPMEFPYGEFKMETMDAQGNVSEPYFKDF